MSWLLEETEGKKGKKYRIWSTVIDGYLTGWMTEKRAKQFLYWNELRKFRDRVTEELMTFPEGYTAKGTHRVFGGKRRKDYLEWNMKTQKETPRLLKLTKLLEEIDIENPLSTFPTKK